MSAELINKIQSEYVNLLQRFYGKEYIEISKNIDHPNRYKVFNERVRSKYLGKKKIYLNYKDDFTFDLHKLDECLSEVKQFWAINYPQFQNSLKNLEAYKIIEGNKNITYVVQMDLNKLVYFDSMCIIDDLQAYADSVKNDKTTLLHSESFLIGLLNIFIILDNTQLITSTESLLPCIILLPPLLKDNSKEFQEFLKIPKREFELFIEKLKRTKKNYTDYELINEARKDFVLGSVVHKVESLNFPPNTDLVSKFKLCCQNLNYGQLPKSINLEYAFLILLMQEFMLTYEMQIHSTLNNLDYGFNYFTFPNIIALNNYNLALIFQNNNYNEELHVGSYFESKSCNEIIDKIDKEVLLRVRSDGNSEELRSLFNFNRKILKAAKLENFEKVQSEINKNLINAVDEYSKQINSADFKRRIIKSSLITTISVGLSITSFTLPQIMPLTVISLALGVSGGTKGIIDLIDDINSGKKRVKNVSQRAIGILFGDK